MEDLKQGVNVREGFIEAPIDRANSPNWGCLVEPLTTAATMPQGIGGQLPHHEEEEQDQQDQDKEEKENQVPHENTMMMMTQCESQAFYESHREEPSTDSSTGLAAEVLTSLEY